MNSKVVIWIMMAIGSYAGSFIPLLWGAGIFSFTSIACSALGGFLGIWIGYKISQGL